MTNQIASLTEILDRYRDAGAGQPPHSVDDDYDHVARHASPEELREGVAASDWSRIAGELHAIGQGHVHTAGIAVFLRHPGFPVDIRHNAKIGRELLAAWATRKS